MTLGGQHDTDSTGTSHSSRPDSPKLVFVMISGERFRMSVGEFWSLLSDWYSVVYFALSGVLIAYLYPETDKLGLTWWQVGLGVAVMETVLFLAIALQYVFWLRVLKGHERIVVPATPTIFFGLVVAESAKLVYADHFWESNWIEPIPLGQAIVTEYVFIFILEVIFSLFVIAHTKVYPSTVINPHAWRWQGTAARLNPDPLAGPPHHVPPGPFHAPRPGVTLASDAMVGVAEAGPSAPVATQRADDTDDPQAPPAEIRLAGEVIDLTQLQLIRAEEHYIRVVTSEGSLLLRHRMMDAIALIPESFGLQVHRSLWLAFSMVERFSRLPDGKLLIVLKDEREVFVPRARRKEVEAQLAENCV